MSQFVRVQDLPNLCRMPSSGQKENIHTPKFFLECFFQVDTEAETLLTIVKNCDNFHLF